MEQQEVEYALEEIVDALLAGRCVLWLGSGLSVSNGHPTWHQLLRNLFRELQENRVSIREDWRLEIEADLERGYYLDAAEGLASVIHHALRGAASLPPTRNTLGKWIKAAFERPHESSNDVRRDLRSEPRRRYRSSDVHRDPAADVRSTLSWNDVDRGQATEAHLVLPLLPFSVVITPNYDSLLEQAYRDRKKPFVRRIVKEDFKGDLIAEAALQPQDRRASKNAGTGGTVIFKTHGEVGEEDSMILTATHYRGTTHGHAFRPFRDYLKALLMTRTFLFVGSGLRDPDLLSVLDELAVSYERIGNHFAIMPGSEVRDLRWQQLRRTYGITVLTYPWEESTTSAEVTPEQARLQNAEVTTYLTRVAGKLASREVGKHDALFSRDRELEQLLDEACRKTQSWRADLCLTEQPGVESALKYLMRTGPTNPPWGGDVTVQSVIGKTFYQATLDGILVPDTKRLMKNPRAPLKDEADQWLNRLRKQYGEFEYKECHEKVRSELAVPIISSGQRVGVLNLESDALGGYRGEHQEAARVMAHRAGVIIATAERRREASRFAEELREVNLAEFFLAHRYLSDIIGEGEGKLVQDLLAADYDTGRLRGEMEFPFDVGGDGDHEAFLLRVFKAEEPILLTHAPNGVKEKMASLRCRDIYRIQGPLLGVPIFRQGVAGVLACWPSLSTSPPDGLYREEHSYNEPGNPQSGIKERRSYFTSQVRGAINRTTNLVLAIAGTANESERQRVRHRALKYVRQLKVASTVEDALSAFMEYQEVARRVLLYQIHGNETFEAKTARPSHVLVRGLVAGTNDEPSIEKQRPPDVSLDATDDYFRYSYWRSYSRYYAEPTPLKFFESSRPTDIGRLSGESWVTAPVVRIEGLAVDSRSSTDGTILVEEVRPTVAEVMGFLEVENGLWPTPGGPSRGGDVHNERDQLCWAVNVLTNVLPELILDERRSEPRL